MIGRCEETCDSCGHRLYWGTGLSHAKRAWWLVPDATTGLTKYVICTWCTDRLGITDANELPAVCPKAGRSSQRVA